MRVIHFHVEGDPKAQPRPRAFARQIAPGKFAARVYDSGTAEGWKAAVALAAKPYLPPTPIIEPVALHVAFFIRRPKRLETKKAPVLHIPCTARPDLENCIKAIMDVCTQIGVWTDDALVVELHASKNYAMKGGRPGAEIRIDVLGSAIETLKRVLG